MKKLLLVVLFLAGCATAKRLNVITVGMSKEAVIELIGRPNRTYTDSTGEYMIYNYANHHALPLSGGRSNHFVQLQNGKVIKAQ